MKGVIPANTKHCNSWAVRAFNTWSRLYYGTPVCGRSSRVSFGSVKRYGSIISQQYCNFQLGHLQHYHLQYGNHRGIWKSWKWKRKLEMKTETGNARAHCDVDLAGGQLSKERLCLSTVKRSSYIASCPGLRIASLFPRHTDK